MILVHGDNYKGGISMSKKNYTKYANKQDEEIINEPIAVKKDAEPVAEDNLVSENKTGIVTNCVRLNVRKEPKTDAAIICEIDNKTEVVIDENASTREFYKVYMASGIEGFCMKKYITIQ